MVEFLKSCSFGVPTGCVGVKFAGLESNYLSLEVSIDNEDFYPVQRDEASPWNSLPHIFSGLNPEKLYRVSGRIVFEDNSVGSTTCSVIPSRSSLGRSHQTGQLGPGGARALKKSNGAISLASARSISAPSGDVSPKVYSTVKNQGDYSNCVAMALSTVMEVFKAIRMGTSSSYENYSVAYIYGSDGDDSDDGMYTSEAINNCIREGSPRWELLSESFPDNCTKSEAIRLHDNVCVLATRNAAWQAFDDYDEIDFYNGSAVKSILTTYGCCALEIETPNNFRPGSNGIIPYPNTQRGDSHVIVIIGLTTIGGKKYWIVQNSWGESWGDDGIAYLPYDWGYNTDDGVEWARTVYKIYPSSSIQTSHPSPHTITNVTRVGQTDSVTVQWTRQTSTAMGLVYARKAGASDWWPKPSYGGAVSGTSYDIILDGLDDANASYDIMVIASYNNVLSSMSEIYHYSPSGSIPPPTLTHRGQYCLVFSVVVPAGMQRYYIEFYDNDNDELVTKTSFSYNTNTGFGYTSVDGFTLSKNEFPYSYNDSMSGHTFKLRGRPNTSPSFSNYVLATALPLYPSNVTVTQASLSSIKVTIEPNPGKWSYFTVGWSSTPPIDGYLTFDGSKDLSDGATAFTITGLREGLTYYIGAQTSLRVTNWGSGGETILSSESWTGWEELKITAISRWDWNNSNGEASPTVTKAAYTAITSKGPTTNFSYLVWNDLVNKVDQAHKAAIGSWDSTYGSLSSTLMSTTNKTLTAQRFKALCRNISTSYSSGLPTVSKGDVVKGSYFTTLTTKLNEWIASI